jgi:DNA-binding transcriptional ArsR family regulator
MEEQEGGPVSFVTLYARIVHELAENPRMAQETLARRLDVTMRTVQRHLTALEEEGYLRVRREKKPFTYEIDWDRPLPYFGQLTVAAFRPDVLEQFSELQGRK